MSEFIDAVQVKLKGGSDNSVTPMRKHLSCYLDAFPARPETPDLERVEFGVSVKSVKYCRKEEIDLIKGIFIDDLTHFVYGEFTHKLRDLRELIVDRKDTDAIRLIGEILDECKGVRETPNLL